MILDLNIFTLDFGKMDVSSNEHFKKVEEEFKELEYAFSDYTEGKEQNIHPAEIEEYRQHLCDEALDMIQASISFVSFLRYQGIMVDEDIEKWMEKLEKRKKKYLK